MAAREVLMTGAVPLNHAAAVIDALAEQLANLLGRMPDGEQIGWAFARSEAIANHGSLQRTRSSP